MGMSHVGAFISFIASPAHVCVRTAPVAAYATVAADNIMTLHAAVIAVDGSATLRATAAGPIDTAENLGMTVARALLDDGASSLLAAS